MWEAQVFFCGLIWIWFFNPFIWYEELHLVWRNFYTWYQISKKLLNDFCQKLLDCEADCEADFEADFEADCEADWDCVEDVFFRWDFTGIEIVSSISNFVFGFRFLWGRPELDCESIFQLMKWHNSVARRAPNKRARLSTGKKELAKLQFFP